MSLRHIAIMGFFGAGALLAAIGLSGYAREALRQRSGAPVDVQAPSRQTETSWIYAGTLFLIVVVAFLLRLEGIDLRGMSHVEVYIPGIELPPLISEPPPRLDFMTFLSWHWHDEPHPQGYYLLMYFWTKIFGTSLESIRLPSIVLGAASVILLYFLAARIYSRKVALIAAAMLAANGHHIYWSQNARMYVLVCFLALASALMFLALLEQTRRRPLLEAGYVLVTFFGLFTQLFFWVFLAAQMLLAAVYPWNGKGNISRLFNLQVIVAIIGSPLWAHAVYRSREIDLGSPTLAFMQDFLNFGFLFTPDYFSAFPPRDIAPGIELVVTVVALACLFGGLMNRKGRFHIKPPSEPVVVWKRLVPLAAGFALIILALALISWRRQALIAATALIPVIALLSIPVIFKLRPRIVAAFDACVACRKISGSGVVFFLTLFAIPVSLLVIVSLFKGLMIERGFLQFVPFMLVVQAAGVEFLARKRVLIVPLLAVLAAIHVYSIDYYRKVPDPTDYRGLAQQMIDRMQDDDLIFVYPRDWPTTPLFYYFQGQAERIVARDYAAALQVHPHSRVWIPLWAGYKEPSEAMLGALEGYIPTDHVSAHKCEADLYTPAKALE